MKSALTAILGLFVAGSLVYLVVGDRDAAPASAPAADVGPAGGGSAVSTEKPPVTDQSRPAAVVVAYYFHGASRCVTCLKMERYAREAVEQNFATEIEQGRVRWQAVNYDEPANEHFLTDYGLVASNVVIVSSDPDATTPWRKLGRIWELVDDEAAFKAYVTDELRALLEGQE